MNWDRLFVSVVAVLLLVLGLRGLIRREFRPRRYWGDIGGPKTFPPMRGVAAIVAGVWLVLCGAGLLAWTWLR